MDEELLRRIMQSICDDCAPGEALAEALWQSILAYLKTNHLIE